MMSWCILECIPKRKGRIGYKELVLFQILLSSEFFCLVSKIISRVLDLKKVLGPVPKVHKLSHATPFSFIPFLIPKLSKGLDSISVAVSKSGSAVVCHFVCIISRAWEMIY